MLLAKQIVFGEQTLRTMTIPVELTESHALTADVGGIIYIRRKEFCKNRGNLNYI